mmetsp:Transcript_12217/g.45299  ORF Transcript_12217/g.45299 Transcript_12217/m.45299 type:complete len:231 (+) Transcript_12217:488-1180(+)
MVLRSLLLRFSKRLLRFSLPLDELVQLRLKRRDQPQLWGQLVELEESNVANFLSSARDEASVGGHARHAEQGDVLLADDGGHALLAINQVGRVEPRLFQHLSNRAVRLVFSFVDLALRKRPGVAVEPFDKHHLVQVLRQQHAAAHGNTGLVLLEALGQLRALIGNRMEQATPPEQQLREAVQLQMRQVVVVIRVEVLVEPMRLLHLHEKPRGLLQLLARQVHQEPDFEVI